MSKRVSLNDDEVAIILRFCENDMSYVLGADFTHRSRLAYQTLVKRLKNKLSAGATVELPTKVKEEDNV